MTLYELLTLPPGFESADRLELMEQIKTEEPAKPRSVDARIPRDLETIVLKAIEKDPSAVPVGRGAGGGPEPVPRRRADPGAWGRRRGAILAVGPGNPVIAVLGGAGDGAPRGGHDRLDGVVGPVRDDRPPREASQRSIAT